MQSAKCRMQNGSARRFSILHSAFCILHSLCSFSRPQRSRVMRELGHGHGHWSSVLGRLLFGPAGNQKDDYECRVQNAECRMALHAAFQFCILHSAFCIHCVASPGHSVPVSCASCATATVTGTVSSAGFCLAPQATSRMTTNAECKMQNAEWLCTPLFNSAFCILHSAFIV